MDCVHRRELLWRYGACLQTKTSRRVVSLVCSIVICHASDDFREILFHITECPVFSVVYFHRLFATPLLFLYYKRECFKVALCNRFNDKRNKEESSHLHYCSMNDKFSSHEAVFFSWRYFMYTLGLETFPLFQ